jgi:hypothetical protein
MNTRHENAVVSGVIFSITVACFFAVAQWAMAQSDELAVMTEDKISITAVFGALHNWEVRHNKCVREGGDPGECYAAARKGFFKDLNLYPPKTLTEEIEQEVQKFEEFGMPDNEIAMLFLEAWGRTYHIHKGDRELLNTRISISFVQHDIMCEALGMEAGCGILGSTGAPPVNQILISSMVQLDTPYGRSIVLHEMVHLLQNLVRGWPESCEDFNANELEARKVQSETLKQAGLAREADFVLRTYRPYTCI